MRSLLLVFISFSLMVSGPAFGQAKPGDIDSTGVKGKAAQAAGEASKTPDAAKKMKDVGDKCGGGVDGAKEQCTEGGSPDLSGIMQALQKAMADQQGAQSDCSNAAKQQQQNQQPQAPAQQAKKKCEGKQKDCKSKCDEAKKDMDELKSSGCKKEAEQKFSGPGKEQEKQQAEDACKKGADEAKQAAESGNDKCSAPVDAQLAGMAAALAGFAQGQKKAEDNQKQMCCQDPTYAAANATECKQVVNCNDITQAQSNPQCICDISARSCKPVTDNGTPPTQENPASSAGGGGGGSNLGSSVTDPFANDTTASTGGSGLPGGGSSGAGGGVKGAGVDASKAAGAKINTAVLGGDYGGGSGGSHNGSSNDEPNGKYSKALKDQLAARAVASEKAQISGSFGPDNWQKIQERYADFRRNVLGR